MGQLEGARYNLRKANTCSHLEHHHVGLNDRSSAWLPWAMVPARPFLCEPIAGLVGPEDLLSGGLCGNNLERVG
jgi:hypothetical protein